jgi:NAD/NADP transhydrogenase beta subunit
LADSGGVVDGRVEAHALNLIAGVAVGMGAGAGAGSRVFVRKIPLLVAKTNGKVGLSIVVCHRVPRALKPEQSKGVNDQVQHICFLDTRCRSLS